MSSKRILKKDINYIFGELIEAVYLREITKPVQSKSDSEALVDEIIAAFDALMVEVNQKNVENNKVHFRKVNQHFQEVTTQLVDKINNL